MKYLLVVLAILILSACGETPSGKQTVELEQPSGQPNAPVPTIQNLQISNTSQSAITLRWSDDNNAHGYRVRRDGDVITVLSSGLFAFADTNLDEGKEYHYEVVAFDSKGRESEALEIKATTFLNNAPSINTSLNRLIVIDSAPTSQVITQIEASDLDGHALSFSLKETNNSKGIHSFFKIDDRGAIQVNGSLFELSGRVFNLQVEVSDGFSISSLGFQLGVVATTSNIDHQGISRNVYNDGTISDDLTVLKNLAAFPDSPSSSSIEPKFQSPSNVGDQYGQRMLGYLVPPVSGEY